MTADDYRTALATASRDEVDAAWNALYDALIPAPAPADEDVQEASYAS